MYKIWINDTPLFLCDEREWQSLSDEGEQLITAYTGDRKFILHHIDMLEKSNRFDAVILYAEDFDQLVDDFGNIYDIVLAAGGVVFNDREEVCLIYKRETWDLPKGKLDEGETAEEAALREVREECGLEELSLGSFLCHSYHTYQEEGKRKLKKSIWFMMKSTQDALYPQEEENIEQVAWKDPSRFMREEENTYPSVRDVLNESLEGR